MNVVNSVTANVSSSASNVTLVAARKGRLGCLIYNDSTQVLYLKYGATATTDSFTVVLPAGSTPTPDALHRVEAGYTGIIDGIWASANGKARITELL